MTTPLRILLVEDREDDTLLALHVLQQATLGPLEHLRVTTERDLRAALTGRSWDIILSDYHLPTMTGKDVIDVRNAACPDLPVIIMTATGSEEIVAQVMKAGAQDYITKGHRQLLVPAIRRVLSEAETRRALRRAEEALQAVIRRFDRLLGAVPLTVYESRASGDFGATWISENVLRIAGFPAERFVADPGFWLSRVHPEDRPRVARELDFLKARGSAAYEYRWQVADGTYRWFVDCASVVKDASGAPAGVIGSWLDVTEHKRVEEMYRQSQKVEAIGQLAGGVAHDFNNLITAILGFGDLALGGFVPEGPVRGYMEEIRKAALRAADLTRRLLVFSRRQPFQPRVCSLNEVVKGLEGMLRRLIGEDVELVVLPGPDLGHVRADPSQIEQVLVNLAVNARDAMPGGGRLVIQTREVDLDEAAARRHEGLQPGPFVTLAATDTGCGMTSEVLSHLFEPFFTTKEPGKGTGLGLATVYGIVKQNGGYIDVSSEPGRGATFTIGLPRTEAEVPVEAAAGPAVSARGGETLLVVEDEASVRAMVVETLRQQGYVILDAEDGEAAMKVCRESPGPIHLLVTDIVMPKLTGCVVAERAQEARPGLKVLFMSGFTGHPAVEGRQLPAGAVLLRKPFTREALLATVRQELDRPGR